MACRNVLLVTGLLAILAGSVTPKTLMLGGGYLSQGNSVIWNKFITLAGGRGTAKIAVISAASNRPIETGREYKAMFESYGVKEAYWAPIYTDNPGGSKDAEVVKKLKTMTGIFFTGGAQQRIIANMFENDRQPTPAFAAIRNMYEAGTPVFGTSAGAMVMPSVHTMVAGTSYGAIMSGARRVDEATGDNSELVYDPLGGLGFIGGHTIDSHFHERGRQGRLLRLLSDTRGLTKGTPYGIGIDEETVLVVTNVGDKNEKAEVIGNAGAFYIDASQSYVDTTAENWRILNVFTHYATSGDVINMNDHTVTFAANKKLIKFNETENNAQTSNDIFAQTITGTVSEFRRVAESLFNSRFDSVTYGTTRQVLPSFYVIMTEDSRSKGYYEENPEGGIGTISYLNMKMEISPVTVSTWDQEY